MHVTGMRRHSTNCATFSLIKTGASVPLIFPWFVHGFAPKICALDVKLDITADVTHLNENHALHLGLDVVPHVHLDHHGAELKRVAILKQNAKFGILESRYFRREKTCSFYIET
jgi:hypothetical protein